MFAIAGLLEDDFVLETGTVTVFKIVVVPVGLVCELENFPFDFAKAGLLQNANRR